MKAFLVKQQDGCFFDTVIRASDENDARHLFAEMVGSIPGEIRADVASVMGVPEERGRYDGALTRWIISPTTFTGELIKE